MHEAVGQAAQSVVKLCMDRKSTDNLTTIIISFGSLGVNNNLGDYASVWICWWEYCEKWYCCDILQFWTILSTFIFALI